MLCVLASLGEIDFFGDATERNSLWSKIEQVYANYLDMLRRRNPLYVSVGRVTLEAWMANPPTNAVPEPGFITALRVLRQKQKSDPSIKAPVRRPIDGSYDPVAVVSFPVGEVCDSFDSQNFNFEMVFNSVSMD
jgi:hypothetical protein